MKIGLMSVYVDNLDKALRFYTETLGFLKKADFSNGPYRWVTVVSPEDQNGTELQLALKAQPDNHTARREYGALFLSMANYQQSRVWYVHALEIDPSDVTSQGWLGCTLVKLGRIDEGMTWIRRAGTGPWSACGNSALPTAPGTLRP